MTLDLFPEPATDQPIATGAFVLRGFALDQAPALLPVIAAIASDAPFRHLMTPGGHEMSVAMTNCGEAGWFSDRSGYRYARQDPASGRPWPRMPDLFLRLARTAAERAGYEDFTPDVCLINRYEPGARMGLHQDRDEGNLTAPIVSVSLGLPARFQFGGRKRSDPTQKLILNHGDVVVWAGRPD